MYSIVLNRDPYKDKYIKLYGKHFNEKLCEFAIEHMKHNGFNPWNEGDIKALLSTHNISIKNNNFYDILYVTNMAKADFLGKSIPDNAHLVQYVKDYLDDEDGYESIAFCRFLADCKALKRDIDWSRML